jgi:hypothetical protein
MSRVMSDSMSGMNTSGSLTGLTETGWTYNRLERERKGDEQRELRERAEGERRELSAERESREGGERRERGVIGREGDLRRWKGRAKQRVNQ